MQDLIQLIYISEIDADSLDSDMVKNILVSAKKNNVAMQITGMLVFDYQYFLQVLEGPKDDIHGLYKVILADSRHKNAKVVKEGSITHRQFGNWTMGFSQSSTKVETLFSAGEIDPDKALTFLLNEAQGCKAEPLNQQT